MRKGTRSKFLAFCATAALATVAATANADSFPLFFYTDNTNTAFGALAVHKGVAIAGSITVTEGLDKGWFPLVANSNAPAPSNFDNSLFQYDDLVFPGQTSKLDVYGLFFQGHGLDINIWDDTNSAEYSLLSYSDKAAGYNVSVSEGGNFYLWNDPVTGIGDLASQVSSLIAGGVKLPDGGKALATALKAASASVARKNKTEGILHLDVFEGEVGFDTVFFKSFSKVEASSLLTFADELKAEIK